MFFVKSQKTIFKLLRLIRKRTLKTCINEKYRLLACTEEVNVKENLFCKYIYCTLRYLIQELTSVFKNTFLIQNGCF